VTDEQTLGIWLCILGLLVCLLFTSVFFIAGTNAEEQAYAELAVQHPSWPWTVINKHEIQLGMTGEMVEAAWGSPRAINRSVGSWGVHEQWVYGSYTKYSSPTYLYFENGILTSWSD